MDSVGSLGRFVVSSVVPVACIVIGMQISRFLFKDRRKAYSSVRLIDVAQCDKLCSCTSYFFVYYSFFIH